MNKTLQMEKEDLLLEIIERIKEETVSFNIYGTDKEDAFLSGINEGISRVIDAMKEIEL
jgi:hypothetical protein